MNAIIAAIIAALPAIVAEIQAIITASSEAPTATQLDQISNLAQAHNNLVAQASALME